MVHALEHQDPYRLSMICVGEPYGRIEISKERLAAELQDWLSGRRLQKPAVVVSERIRNSILNFIKFGTPPRQVDLFLWLLSRTEIIVRGKDSMDMCFGGATRVVGSEAVMTDSRRNYSEMEKTNPDPKISSSMKGTASNSPSQPTRERPMSAPHSSRRPARRDSNNALSTFAVTDKILGKSQALSQLPQRRVKGREGATQSYVRVDWTDDHYRLTNRIASRRHELEEQMETRRKILAVSHARQIKAMEKFCKIRESLQKSRTDYNWCREAGHEVMTLDRINETISEDIRRQKSRAIRTAEHIRWTMAPNGFVNRRGSYKKGISIGPGPLPADATTALHNPRMQFTVNHYYWDQHGRRHLKTAADVEEGSVVDEAMKAIRRAAVNASLYKLDLKSVFHDIDTSGDGFITISEMGQAFARLGLKLEDKVLDALFSHFDPNGSGSVHYGEFVWAFFNRRSLVSQWKRATKNLTKAQVTAKFRQGDKNGDGRLNKKEFKRLLGSFSIKLSDADIDILIDRFDRDGDGDLDLYEFADFVKREMSTAECTEPEKVTQPTIQADTVNVANELRNHQLQNQKYRDRRVESADGNEDNIDPPEYDEKEGDHLEETKVVEYARSDMLTGSKTINLDQLTESLQRQATLESKLGRKYYPTMKPPLVSK